MSRSIDKAAFKTSFLIGVLIFVLEEKKRFRIFHCARAKYPLFVRVKIQFKIKIKIKIKIKVRVRFRFRVRVRLRVEIE